MISYLQDLLQRRGKPIFLILLAVIVVAFVFVIGEQPGIVTGDPRQMGEDFYGFNLQNQRDPQVRGLVEDTQLSFLLRNGRQMFSQQEFEIELRMRAAYLDMIQRYNIPRPGQGAMQSFIESLELFQDRQGRFDREFFSTFYDARTADPRGGEEQFARVVEQDWRIEQVRQAKINPGFVLPFEAMERARRQHTVWSIHTASKNLDDFETEVRPSEETLENYYLRNAGRYEVPVQARTLKTIFKTEFFESRVEAPDHEELRDWHQRHSDRYPMPEGENGDDGEIDAGELDPFDYHREQIVADLIRDRAKRKAEIAANDFAFKLYDEEISLGSEAFDAMAEEFNLEFEELEPFSQEDGPTEVDLPRNIIDRVFRLGNRTYFTDPFPVDHGTALVFLKERIDPRVPPLEEIREQVLADYKREEKLLRFSEHGDELRARLRQAVADGEDFADYAESLGLRVSSFEDFTLDNPPSNLPQHLAEVLTGMRKDEVSQMRIRDDRGSLVHVFQREVPDLSPDSPEVVQAREQLRQESGFLVQNGFIEHTILSELANQQR